LLSPEAIRKALRASGSNQSDLARALGWHLAAASHFLSGDYPAAEARLARVQEAIDGLQIQAHNTDSGRHRGVDQDQPDPEIDPDAFFRWMGGEL
jgi:hypothetical protein